jgi:ribosomal protein S18 acetylase RimI-like enzyme
MSLPRVLPCENALVDDELEIRPARPEDAADAAAVHYRSWVATYRPLIRPDQAARLTLAERVAHWVRLLKTRPPHMGALLAVRSGAIVGLVEWEIGPGGDADAGEIHAIHVALEERGRGVGRRLLDASVGALRDHDVRRAILWVVEDNTSARAFYERQGWAWDGARVERSLGGIPDFPMVVEVRYALVLSEPPTASVTGT